MNVSRQHTVEFPSWPNFHLFVFSLGYFSLSFSSVQFSHSVMSDSLRPQGPQQARPPCPSPAPGVYSNSSPLSQRCHPTISSSVIPLCSSLSLLISFLLIPLNMVVFPRTFSLTGSLISHHFHIGNSYSLYQLAL